MKRNSRALCALVWAGAVGLGRNWREPLCSGFSIWQRRLLRASLMCLPSDQNYGLPVIGLRWMYPPISPPHTHKRKFLLFKRSVDMSIPCHGIESEECPLGTALLTSSVWTCQLECTEQYVLQRFPPHPPPHPAELWPQLLVTSYHSYGQQRLLKTTCTWTYTKLLWTNCSSAFKFKNMSGRRAERF